MGNASRINRCLLSTVAKVFPSVASWVAPITAISHSSVRWWFDLASWVRPRSAASPVTPQFSVAVVRIPRGSAVAGLSSSTLAVDPAARLLFLGLLLDRHRQRQGLLAGHAEMVDLLRVPLHLRHELVLVRRLDCPAAVAAHSPDHR
jgi:hypothetical protein